MACVDRLCADAWAQIRAPRTHSVARLAEAAGLGVLTIVTMFLLSYWLGTCVDVPEWHESGFGFTFHCKNGDLRPQHFLCACATAATC